MRGLGAEKSVESRSGMSQQSIVVGMLVALLATSSSTYAQEMSGLIQAMKKGPAVDINEVLCSWSSSLNFVECHRI
ncbi:MAG: hypothetical protein ACPIOQ_17595 [Promethearchaeia archaeon]